MPPPAPSVLEAFSVTGTPAPLAGGEGTSWRAGGVVLKVVHDSDEASWCQEVLARVVEDGFRRPEPVAGADGQFVVDGWIASRYIDGLRDGRPRWRQIVDAGVRFHRALADVHASPEVVLARRRHVWAVADRVAWGESDVELSGDARSLHEAIRARLEPLDLDSQLIHGDLGGNVLFDADDTPVVIDFSPYVRSERYATAIVVGDALLWEGAGLDVLDLLGLDDVGLQLVLRAVIFRLVAEQLAVRPPHHGDVRPYRRVFDELARL